MIQSISAQVPPWLNLKQHKYNNQASWLLQSLVLCDGVFLDRSGNGNNGTVLGSPVFRRNWGNINGATPSISADTKELGSTGVSLGNFWSPTSTNVTLMAWVNQRCVPTSGYVGAIISKNEYYASSVTQWPIALVTDASGNLVFNLSTGNDYTVDLSLTCKMPINRWCLVAGVFEYNGTSRLLIDGRRVDSGASNFALSSSSVGWRIGCHTNHGASGGDDKSTFNGCIAWAGIWNGAIPDLIIRQMADEPWWPYLIGYSREWLVQGSPGNTYNESGRGGIFLGSSSLILANYVPSSSGGISMGSSNLGIAAYNPTATGGAIFGGQSSGIAAYVPSTSGGLILGGTSALSAVYVITASGGAVVGGTTSPGSQIHSESGSGGIGIGGTATTTAIYTPTVAGGVSLGGSASIVITYTIVGSGGVVTGGYGVITTPLQIVNLIYGRPLEITRITDLLPVKSLHVELLRVTAIEVSQMSLTITQVTKTTSDNLTYTFDLRRISFLQNDPITGTPTVSQLSGTGSLTFTTPEVSGELVTVGIGGGTAGQTYRVGLLVTTTNGRIIDGLVDIRVVSRTSSG